MHDSSDDSAWHAAQTQFTADMHAAAQTSDGAYVVGGGGLIATSAEGGWSAVVDDGPASKGRTLRAVSPTDDGSRIWVVGDNGALGAYDVDSGSLQDHSTGSNAWRDVAVAGEADNETVLVVDESGSVTPISVDGGNVTPGSPIKPGSGSTIVTAAISPEGIAFAADSSGNVFRSTGVAEWEDIGIFDADVGFNDIVAKKGRVYVAADAGRLFRYDDTYGNWTPIDIAGPSLRAVDIHDRHLWVLTADGDLYWRGLTGDVRWEHLSLPGDNDLLDLSLGAPDVAVGKEGTVIVRPPGEHDGGPASSPGEAGEKADLPVEPQPKPTHPKKDKSDSKNGEQSKKDKSNSKKDKSDSKHPKDSNQPKQPPSGSKQPKQPPKSGQKSKTTRPDRKRTESGAGGKKRTKGEKRTGHEAEHRRKEGGRHEGGQQHPDPCPIILEELLGRLSKRQLVELLAEQGCYSSVVEAVRESEREELAELLSEVERRQLRDC